MIGPLICNIPEVLAAACEVPLGDLTDFEADELKYLVDEDYSSKDGDIYITVSDVIEGTKHLASIKINSVRTGQTLMATP